MTRDCRHSDRSPAPGVGPTIFMNLESEIARNLRTRDKGRETVIAKRDKRVHKNIELRTILAIDLYMWGSLLRSFVKVVPSSSTPFSFHRGESAISLNHCLAESSCSDFDTTLRKKMTSRRGL